MRTHVTKQSEHLYQIIFEFNKHPKIDRIETKKNEEVLLLFPNVILDKKEAKDTENKIKSIRLVKKTSVVSGKNGTRVTMSFEKDSVTPVTSEQDDGLSSLTIDLFKNNYLKELKYQESTHHQAQNSSFRILDFDQIGQDVKKKIFHIKIV